MTKMPETSTQNLIPKRGSLSLRRRRWIMLPLVALGCLGVVLLIVSGLRAAASETAARAASLRAAVFSAGAQGGDFSKFSHTQTHSALPCLLCHRRESNAPRPSLPGHTPCAGCHAQS